MLRITTLFIFPVFPFSVVVPVCVWRPSIKFEDRGLRGWSRKCRGGTGFFADGSTRTGYLCEKKIAGTILNSRNCHVAAKRHILPDRPDFRKRQVAISATNVERSKCFRNILMASASIIPVLRRRPGCSNGCGGN